VNIISGFIRVLASTPTNVHSFTRQLQLGYRLFFSMSQQPPRRSGPSQYRGFTVTFRNTTLGRTPLGKWSVGRTELYLTTHTHDRQTSMLSAVFEPAISANERSQTHALDRAVTGIGWFQNTLS